MRNTSLIVIISCFLFTQAISAAEPNGSDANGLRARSARNRGIFQSERAIINWHDGIQQMVVSPRLSRDSNNLWLFPVKARSEQVKFSLAKGFPSLLGPDSSQIAGKRLDKIKYALVATQLWSIPLYYFRSENPDYRFTRDANYVNITKSDANGIHIEVLSAESPSALARQLQEHGKSVSESELNQYSRFINNQYSILGVWRQGSEPNLPRGDARRAYRRRPVLYVEFPAENPFYPVIQRTGRFGRLSVTLIGLWQIAGQEHSPAFACDQRLSDDSELLDLFGISPADHQIPYTIFTMASDATAVPDELVFVQGRASGYAYPDAILKMPYFELIPLAIVVLVIISYLSAGVSGLIAYRKWNGFAGFGLFNLLSILAVGIAMNYMKGGTAEVFRQNKPKARLFLACFSILVVLFSFAVFAVLKMPLDVQ
jgi:hypothetical protein